MAFISKERSESIGVPCLVHTGRSECILPTPLRATQRRNLSMELLQVVSVHYETGDGAFICRYCVL